MPRRGPSMGMLRLMGCHLALLLACLAAADATTSAPSALPSPLPAPLPTPLPTPHWYLRGATDAPTAAPTGTRRCSWDRVKDTQCRPQDQIRNIEDIYAKADARARCEALDRCDGYMWTKAASSFYTLCGFKGKKDGCGRPRIDRVGDHGQDGAVFMCRPYNTTPAWRDPVAFWLCLCIAVLVFPICFCVSWHLLEQVFEQKDGYVATYGTSQGANVRRWSATFVVLLVALPGLLCFGVSRGPTDAGDKDGCSRGAGEAGVALLRSRGSTAGTRRRSWPAPRRRGSRSRTTARRSAGRAG